MKNNIRDDVNKENIDIANSILEDSKNFSDTNIKRPPLNDILDRDSSKKVWCKKDVYRIATAVAACIVLVIGFGALPINNNNSQEPNTKTAISTANDYSAIYEKLLSCTKSKAKKAKEGVSSGAFETDLEYAVPEDAIYGTLTDGYDNTKDYYDTNAQTENVSEADIVKTDGNYIYSCNYFENKNLVITKVDGFDMKVVCKVEVDSNIYEFYVCGDKLVAIGSNYDNLYHDGAKSNHHKDQTDIYIIDISNPESATLTKKMSQDGFYVSSRVNGNNLYLITSKYVYDTDLTCGCDCYIPQINEEPILADKIYIPEEIENSSFTVISSFDITSSKLVDNMAVLGGSSEIYVSQDNIYVLNSVYYDKDITNTDKAKELVGNNKVYDYEEIELSNLYKDDITWWAKQNDYDIDFDKVTVKQTTFIYTSYRSTDIIKFSYKDEDVNFINSTRIDGGIENNMNFDESDGYLRCVTTSENYSYRIDKLFFYDENGKSLYDSYIKKYNYLNDEKSSNNVFVLNEDLKVVADITGLAENEEIYSARYMGDYGYFVTYEETDPLFTVDFSNMENPKIVGELEMPGVSEYLHFYSNDLLLGFGFEDIDGRFGSCLKLEMYDISSEIAQKKSKLLLEEYFYSEALYDYKSMLIDPGKNLIGFFAEGDHDYYVVYTYKNNKFKELYKVQLKKAYSVRGLYIDSYLYIVVPGRSIYAIDMNTYKDNNKVEKIKLN